MWHSGINLQIVVSENSPVKYLKFCLAGLHIYKIKDCLALFTKTINEFVVRESFEGILKKPGLLEVQMSESRRIINEKENEVSFFIS